MAHNVQLGPKVMAWSWDRGVSGWVLEKGSSLRGWLGTGTGCPGQWSWHQDCGNSRSIWTMLSDIGSGWCCMEQGVGLSDPCGLSNSGYYVIL